MSLLQLSNVHAIKRTFIQPSIVCYLHVRLDQPNDDSDIEELMNTCSYKAVVSNVYGQDSSITLTVINDYSNFAIFEIGNGFRASR